MPVTTSLSSSRYFSDPAAAMSLSASATLRGRPCSALCSTARPSRLVSSVAGTKVNLAADASSSARPRRSRPRRGELAIAASLVGFNRPSPPWPSLMRGSSARELLDSGTRRRSSSQQQPLFDSIHHVGLLVSNLEKSLEFYQGVLGLALNSDRPDAKLPYRGAWLWVGNPEEHSQMIHLMELPNPDPTEGRPAHGGRDRHFCVSVRSVDAVTEKLNGAGVPFTLSASGRKAVFYRDPDGNVLECAEMGK